MSPPSAGWQLRARSNFKSAAALPVDARRARLEWLALAEHIEAAGGTVCALRNDDDALTGMPFAAEAGHVVGNTFLLPRMLHAHRQPERMLWQALAEAMGLQLAAPSHGVWEAQGDVAMHDGATLLFYGGRTTHDALSEVRSFFAEPGRQGQHAPILELEIREPAFHGNMALLSLPDRVLACRSAFAPRSWEALSARFRVEEITETELRLYATNGLSVGKTFLAPSCAPPRVLGLVRASGLAVRTLVMSELCEKAGGASRCLVSVADLDPQRIPPENRLSRIRDSLEQ